MLDRTGEESSVLPRSTRIVNTMEIKVEREARRAGIFRRRVAEDLDVGGRR